MDILQSVIANMTIILAIIGALYHLMLLIGTIRYFQKKIAR